MSVDCPACVYDEIYTDMGNAIAKLDAWLASPHADKDAGDKTMVQRLRDELEGAQKDMAKVFFGD